MSESHPTRFGKYLLLEKLAVGGMAQLYRAKITGFQGFEKLIAIKTILPHLSNEKELLSSFIDEAKLAALLHHQNIVQIYDFGTMESSYFIAMEFLLGKDLRQIFGKSQERNLPLSNEHALYITHRICSGLDYAYTLKDFQGKPLNIIHRDISPQNIFVTYEGEIKIVDFGIAKAASQSTITHFGMIKGKVAYMSPEQASGQITDHRSDIFSTGIILYEMVIGKQMFTGADTLQILAKVCRAEFEPPEVARSGLPSQVYEILHKALKKDREERYQSCGEMLADIEECMFKLSMRPTTRGLSQYMKHLFEEEIATEGETMREAVPVRPEEEPVPKKIEEPPKKLEEKPIEAQKPKKRGVLYGAIGAVLIIMVVVVAFLLKEKPAPTPSKSVPQKPPEKAVVTQPTEIRKPGVKTPDRSAEAKALQDQATGLMDKNPQEAKSLLLKAVQLDPKSAKGYFQLGVTCMKLKEYPEAIEAYQKSGELDPNFPDTYFNLGYIYAMGKDFSKAEEMYNRTVNLKPSYLDEALFNLGMVQEWQGKRKESVENLERALSLNPNNEMARKFLDKLKRKS
jgi:serine/threonine protein kinase